LDFKPQELGISPSFIKSEASVTKGVLWSWSKMEWKQLVIRFRLGQMEQHILWFSSFEIKVITREIVI